MTGRIAEDRIVFVGGNLRSENGIEISAVYEPLKPKADPDDGGCKKCQRYLFRKRVQLPKNRIVAEFGTALGEGGEDTVAIETRAKRRICYCGCCGDPTDV